MNNITQEEKFKVVLNYLKKLIEERGDVRVSTQGNGYYTSIVEYDNDRDKKIKLFEFHFYAKTLYVNYKDGGYMYLNLSDEQSTEFSYLFHQIRKIAEEKVIQALITFSK